MCDLPWPDCVFSVLIGYLVDKTFEVVELHRVRSRSGYASAFSLAPGLGTSQRRLLELQSESHAFAGYAVTSYGDWGRLGSNPWVRRLPLLLIPQLVVSVVTPIKGSLHPLWSRSCP